MTVSTVSHDDAVLDHAKRHLRRDQDYSDNDRSLSDTHEQCSYRPSSDNTDHNAAAQQITHRRSNSPSRLDQRHPAASPKALNDSSNGSRDVDGIQRRRSNSFEDSHRQSAYENTRWSQENGAERPDTYPRSARTSNEHYETQHRRDADEGQMDDDEDVQRLQIERVGERRSPSEGNSQDDDEDMQDDLMYDDDNMEDDDSEENEDGSSSRNDDEGNPSKKVTGADLADSTVDGVIKPIKVRSMFVDKLYRMVEDPSIQHLISWAKEGDMFYVYNCIKLADTVLPKFFKHNNWQSFVRQLNMYGFHKIYRYDREESSLNRKNPETQRWQFYHPHFQRDLPHLRDNIKRKSARSMNTAPATSRVVFEHGKGYFLQRNDRSRSNSGEGGHNMPGQVHAQSRPTPPHLSPGQQNRMPHLTPHQNQIQQPGASMRHPGQTSPKAHPSLTRSPREPEHRDTMMAQDRPQYPSPYQGMHQRQHTYPNAHSLDRSHGHLAPGSPITSHDPRLTRPPHPSSSFSAGGSGSQGFRPMKTHTSNEYGSESPHEAPGHLRSRSVPGIDHRKSGLPSREPNQLQDNPHSPPGFQQSGSGSAYAQNHQHRSYGSTGDISTAIQVPTARQPSGSPRDTSVNSAYGHALSHPSHRPQAIKDSPQLTPSLPSSSKFNVIPPPPSSAAAVSSALGVGAGMPSPAITSPSLTSAASQHQQQQQQSFSRASRGPPGSPRSPRHADQFQQIAVKELEGRIHLVEDAYMSLRQYTEKLEQLQTSQDRIIQWMRERIEQMTEVAHARREPAASPLTPQSGVVISAKRKAESISEDPRSRMRYDSGAALKHEPDLVFSAEGPDHHHLRPQHHHSHSRGGSGPSHEGPFNGGYNDTPSAQSGQQHHHHHPQQHAHYQDQPHHAPQPHGLSHQQHQHQHQQHPHLHAQVSHNRHYRTPTVSGKPY
ncbi:hypothetical protein BGZ58_007873 [Dissophora ornata]|nr:hypothetical protein BGZ58_007873 [Dissophora ornata]